MPQICALVAAEKGGDTLSSAVDKATSAASAGLAGATSLVGGATKTPGAPGTGATPAPGAAGRNLAGVGFAAAVVVLAL